MPINPLFITDFNRVRLEFVGHYRDVCENPASSTLWLDVGRNSSLQMTYQPLALKNDLSAFPVPFFDPRDNRPLNLPMVFAGSPDVTEQLAASIVASGLVPAPAGVARVSRLCTTKCRTKRDCVCHQRQTPGIPAGPSRGESAHHRDDQPSGQSVREAAGDLRA